MNKAITRLATIIEGDLIYDTKMIDEARRKEANIMWISDVILANLSAIKHIRKEVSK